MRPAVIAHRGASAARQENTVDAFRHAVELGSDWVELDVRLSTGSDLVIHHDAELADGRPIFSTARSDLPEWLPTLAEALDAAAPIKVNIEIKNDPSEKGFDPTNAVVPLVAELAAELRPLDELLVTSFNQTTVDRMGEVAPDMPRGLLTYQEAPDKAALSALVELGYVALHPWYPFVTAQLISDAHEVGLVVNTWTVDDPKLMRTLTEWGIDGIVTNVPDVARKIVDEAAP